MTCMEAAVLLISAAQSGGRLEPKTAVAYAPHACFSQQQLLAQGVRIASTALEHTCGKLTAANFL